MCLIIRCLFLIMLPFLAACSPQNSSNNSAVKVCFTPQQDCAQDVLSNISQAQDDILVQTNSFTSMAVAKALITAKLRGVDVNVILDKSQLKQKDSLMRFLSAQGVPVWIDYKPAIAQNKVMIVDSKTVLTGSYTFSRSEQENNSANLIIIQDPVLIKKYLNNWQERLKNSQTMANYIATLQPQKIVQKKNFKKKPMVAINRR